MRMQFPDGDGPLDPEWFRPLVDVFPSVPAEGSLRFFDLEDFMVMGRVLRRPRPDVTIYKHRYTRRYLNLDGAGQAYRYLPPASGSNGYGSYRRHGDLGAALAGLGLWELPKLKPSLARLLGVDPPFDGGAIDTDGRDAGEEVRHGHLRMV